MHDSEKKLSRWFRSLPPEKRLEIAVQIEEFRRGARFAEAGEDIPDIERA